MNRRALLASLAAAFAERTPARQTSGNKDWVCPMDPDVRSDRPGVCPRCGMQLVLSIPDRIEYPLEIAVSSSPLLPGKPFDLRLRVLNPATGAPVMNFEIVHEKLLHLFVVSENLEFFAHVHPQPAKDGSFSVTLTLPYGGMYRLLADYYPAESVPQLAVSTLFVSGSSPKSDLKVSLGASRATNLTAALSTDPTRLIAGLESRLILSLDPASGLEPYLGAWGHMLACSDDLIDLLHVHPFLVKGGIVQFNLIFPRPGLYRVWTQFQRAGVVNLVTFTLPVERL